VHLCSGWNSPSDKQDVNGDTALTLVRCLLERGRYAAALTLAQRLVAAGADVNHRYTDKGIFKQFLETDRLLRIFL
jgi:hypothetical protein